MKREHKEPTISFRPSAWERAIIEERAALSGMYKKYFIARSCVYSNIVVVGKKENIQRIVNALQEMQIVMKEIAGQIKSGNFTLNDDSYEELKRDYLALVITIIDIVDGAAYLFEKKSPDERKNWKTEQEIEQYRQLLKRDSEGEVTIEKGNNS